MAKTTSSTRWAKITPAAFLENLRKNTQLSTLARDIGVNKGLLSMVINGKRRASNVLIVKLNTKYGVRLPLNRMPKPPGPTFAEKVARGDAWAAKNASRILTIVDWARGRAAARRGETETK